MVFTLNVSIIKNWGRGGKDQRQTQMQTLGVNQSLGGLKTSKCIKRHLEKTFLPPAYEVREKVLFSVCLFTGGGYSLTSASRSFPGRGVPPTSGNRSYPGVGVPPSPVIGPVQNPVPGLAGVGEFPNQVLGGLSCYHHAVVRRWMRVNVRHSVEWYRSRRIHSTFCKGRNNNLIQFVNLLQGAMSATFKAINASPKPALEPVGASFLAQRRGKNRPKSSTEV